MDDNKRDIYNRFGESRLDADPRLNELRAILELLGTYVFWGILVFSATIPKGSKGCRIWISLILLSMISIEGLYTIFDGELTFRTLHFTEHEIILMLHKSFPFILMILVSFSQFYFLSTEIFAVDTLDSVLQSQQVRLAMD
jgi:hypothetical protein